MAFRFEKLEIWLLARDFIDDIYRITRKFPKEEVFGLISQLRAAAVSVALNIAEGSDRGSDKDFERFIRISLASLEEVVTGLYISKDQDFLNQEEFNFLYQKADKLAAKLNAFLRTLR